VTARDVRSTRYRFVPESAPNMNAIYDLTDLRIDELALSQSFMQSVNP